MTKVPNFVQTDNYKNNAQKVSHLTISIFEHYFDEQVKPFKKHITRKYKRLQRLYESDLLELPEKDLKYLKFLESEIGDYYQAFIAMDELKNIYVEHIKQLSDKPSNLNNGDQRDHNQCFDDATFDELISVFLDGETPLQNKLAKKKHSVKNLKLVEHGI